MCIRFPFNTLIMKILISEDEFKKSKYCDLIPLECEYCHRSFNSIKTSVTRTLKGHKQVVNKYCSISCSAKARGTYVTTKCSNCQLELRLLEKRISNSGRNFCSLSCSASYNNRNKHSGYRRSKMETFFESMIQKKYPNIEFNTNDRKTIGAELDFYFPQLRFALELNGIFHYEPIYKNKNFEKIQNVDKQKMTSCLALGVELYVLDTSGCKRFSITEGEKYWAIFQDTFEKVIQRI